MFSRSARLSVYSIVLPVILVIYLTASIGLADWNSGVTIEDVSTRIAINIVDQGVMVTVNLTENAVGQLRSMPSEDFPVAALEKFALEVIKIQTGQQLKPNIKISKNADSKKAVSGLFFDVFFPFSGEKPQQLDIVPDFKLIETAGKKYIVSVSHQGLPVIDHGILTTAETLQLNWQDPWYSNFSNPKLKRGHSDPVMAFLYIEPQKIKTEIVVRIKEMAKWTDLGLRDETLIYPDEYPLVKEKISRFFLDHNKLSADAKVLSPTLDRVDYIRMGVADIQAYQPQKPQRQVATLIGVSMIHQTKALPSKVQWEWNLYNEKIQRVAIRAYDPAGLFDSYVTPEYRVFEWENMLADIDLPELTSKPQSTPVAVDHLSESAQYSGLFGMIVFLVVALYSCKVISPEFRKHGQISVLLITLAMGYYLFKDGKLVVLDKQAPLEQQQVKPILNQLLWNVYQAFESDREDVAYDQLADSVSGDLQETLYLQNRQALLQKDGAQSKVNRIEIQDFTNLSSTFDHGYLFECAWLVIGEVIHWGHQHRRENLYRANIKIVPVEGNWKIVELESIGQQRVQ